MEKQIIQTVEPGSPADRAGVQTGEILTHVNGVPILDVLDYKYYTYDPNLDLTLAAPCGHARVVKVKKQAGEALGLEFETYLMDKARSCANQCIFCFVDQMPKGMRGTLYFKDDDARLSFLMGNYITLTNLSDREIQRIIDLRISPINVSVHTTNPELRCKMLGHRNAGKSIDVMRRFANAGITMNCQIVACPGINDGPELERSMRELADMHPGVKSVSVVPVGVTKFREGLYPLASYTKETAGALLNLVEEFAGLCWKRFGTRMFWCSDELYLKAERPLPSDDYFEDYTQLENGVGMLTSLRTEFRGALLTVEEGAEPAPFSIATGVSAAPFLQEIVDLAAKRCHTMTSYVYPVINHYFGETITVAGLVTGQDLMEQLTGKPLGQRLLIPSSMLRQGEHVFLDDVTLEQVSTSLGVPVTPVEQDGFALLDAIFGLEQDEKDEGEWEICSSEDEGYYRYNPPAKGGCRA